MKPDILHLVTIKPVLYGGIAARFFSSTRVVAAISGLGYVFVGTTTIAHVRRLIIGLIYRLALGGRHLRVIFQNPIDKHIICSLGVLPEYKTLRYLDLV